MFLETQFRSHVISSPIMDVPNHERGSHACSLQQQQLIVPSKLISWQSGNARGLYAHNHEAMMNLKV
jgi:hypothetical protein